MAARWPERIQSAGRAWVRLRAPLREWNDHEEDCSDRCGPRARPGRVPSQDRENAVGNEADVENAAAEDVNAATVDAGNAAENALDAASNQIENAGEAVENAAEAVGNAAENAAD